MSRRIVMVLLFVVLLAVATLTVAAPVGFLTKGDLSPPFALLLSSTSSFYSGCLISRYFMRFSPVRHGRRTGTGCVGCQSPSVAGAAQMSS